MGLVPMTVRPADYVTTLFLSEDELVEIYTMLLKMEINSYPDSFDPTNAPDADVMTESSVPMKLVLEAYGEKVNKTVHCSEVGSWRGYDAKAQAFLDACNRIEEIITDSDEWKALPEYEILYE